MFQLDLKSSVPIYEQIVEQIKTQIANGTLPPQSALPSIRALAKQLNISVITTKRAYAELEQLGFIKTTAGKGSFVCGTSQLATEHLLKTVEHTIVEAIKHAKIANLSKAQLIEMTDTLWEELK